MLLVNFASFYHNTYYLNFNIDSNSNFYNLNILINPKYILMKIIALFLFFIQCYNALIHHLNNLQNAINDL